jgi:hypothetical protein
MGFWHVVMELFIDNGVDLLTMEKAFLIFAWIGFSSSIYAASQTNGFLVFEIERDAYSTNGRTVSDVTERFKIPLTDEFLSNFKHGPIPYQSMGTGFLCRGGVPAGKSGGMSFAWWMHRTKDHRWYINMWSDGAEKVNGRVMGMGNPSCSQEITIAKLDDLWMRYTLSFVNIPGGVNVGFTAKFEPAKDIVSEKTMLTPPVKRADGSMLFIGGDQSKQPINLDCLFQED